MIPQPTHLGPVYGAIFKDACVVAAYDFRPAYPEQVFAILRSLVVDTPRRVLDVGCGTGHVARRLAPLVESVDAVDCSSAMIEKAKQLPGGDRPNLSWILATVEEAPLKPPYALITAGESLHWLAWDVVFPRFVGALTAQGQLAMIDRRWDRSPRLWERLGPIFARYSTNRDYRPYDLVAELELRGLFQKIGEVRTDAESWQPTIDEYLECRHSQNGLSRERMGDSAEAFDEAVRQVLVQSIRDNTIELRAGRLQLEVEAKVVWGKPTWPGLG